MNKPASNLGDNVIRAVKERLETEEKIAVADFLGSAEDGHLRTDSDIDIALLPAQGATFSGNKRLDLGADLATFAGRTADLGILKASNLAQAKEALSRGRIVFEGVLSMDADLQETRHGRRRITGRFLAARLVRALALLRKHRAGDALCGSLDPALLKKGEYALILR